jgi:hypothetical protein
MSRSWLSGGVLVCLAIALVFLFVRVGTAVPQSLRNVQVMTEMSERELQQTMQSWTRQFGVTCFECHVPGDFASDAMERKVAARRMAELLRVLNETPYFAESSRKADCFMCHQGSFAVSAFD